MIAALFVETNGCYFGLPDVDPWDEPRDARKYAGPHPVVAHPPCQRWGRFWHGSTRKPHRFRLGDDGGCFRAALHAVRRFGGVIEHPADSHAWAHFGISKPPREGGWTPVVTEPRAWTCEVSQGHYGHLAGKRTWLYVAGIYFGDLPKLRWGRRQGQNAHPQRDAARVPRRAPGHRSERHASPTTATARIGDLMTTSSPTGQAETLKSQAVASLADELDGVLLDIEANNFGERALTWRIDRVCLDTIRRVSRALATAAPASKPPADDPTEPCDRCLTACPYADSPEQFRKPPAAVSDEPCTVCHGRGEVQRRQRMGECDFDEWEETCPACDGDGKLPHHLNLYIDLMTAHNKAQHDTIIRQQAKLMIGRRLTEERITELWKEYALAQETQDITMFARAIEREINDPLLAESGAPATHEATAFEEAVAAGDGTLHHAIDYWQERALKAEAALAATHEARAGGEVQGQATDHSGD